MSLTLITDPTGYQLSKNIVIAEIETDAYQITAGGYAELTLSPSGSNAVGGVFNLIWETDSVLMTIVAGSIDDSGTEVREKGANSASAYAIMVAEDLNKNYTLSDLYTIEASGSDVILTAKQKGIKYDLTASSIFTNSGYAPNAPTLPADDSYAENYKMKADLYMESEFGEDDFTKVSSQDLDPIQNRCAFDFQEEINANLEYDLPTFNQSTAVQCKNVIKRFYLKYVERFGNPVMPQQVHQTNNGYAIKAGVSTEGYAGGYVIDNLYVNNFLTRQPRTKKVKENQKEYLYFLADGFGTTYYLLRIDFTLKNKSTVPFVYKYTINPADILGVYCMPVGYAQMNTGSFPKFSDIEKYTVSMVDGGVGTPPVVSEVFTYYADHDSYVDETYILFSNGRGGVDTARFTGVKETGFSIDKETSQRIRLFDDNATVAEFFENNILKQDVFKINTGWINKTTADWLQDFFTAEVKLLVTSSGFIPIVIENVSEAPYNSKSTTHFYEIVCRVAYKNKATKEYV